MKRVLLIIALAASIVSCQKQTDMNTNSLLSVTKPTGPVVPIDIPKNTCELLHVTIQPFTLPKAYTYMSGFTKMLQYMEFDAAGRITGGYQDIDYYRFDMTYDSRGNLSKIDVHYIVTGDLVRVFEFYHSGGIGNNFSNSIRVQEFEVVNEQKTPVQTMNMLYDNQYRIVRADLEGGKKKYWYYYDTKGNLEKIDESLWAGSPKPYLRFYDYDNMKSPNTINRVWQILSGFHYVNNPRRINVHQEGSGVVRSIPYTYSYYNFYPSIMVGNYHERMLVFKNCN